MKNWLTRQWDAIKADWRLAAIGTVGTVWIAYTELRDGGLEWSRLLLLIPAALFAVVWWKWWTAPRST